MNNLEYLKNNVAIILVAPQMGENIGSVARVMKNFGLKDLRLVSPRDGWPNQRAESLATSGVDIIKSAKIYDKLKDALQDLNYIYASTARPRSTVKKVIYSTELTSDYQDKGKIGIMFGRESSGLSNEEVAMAQSIVTINYTEYGSLNLAQAAGLVCYEVFNGACDALPDGNIDELASKGEFDLFINVLEQNLIAKKFFNGDIASPRNLALRTKIRNLLAKIEGLNKTDLSLLHGIFK